MTRFESQTMSGSYLRRETSSVDGALIIPFRSLGGLEVVGEQSVGFVLFIGGGLVGRFRARDPDI